MSFDVGLDASLFLRYFWSNKFSLGEHKRLLSKTCKRGVLWTVQYVFIKYAAHKHRLIDWLIDFIWPLKYKNMKNSKKLFHTLKSSNALMCVCGQVIKIWHRSSLKPLHAITLKKKCEVQLRLSGCTVIWAKFVELKGPTTPFTNPTAHPSTH